MIFFIAVAAFCIAGGSSATNLALNRSVTQSSYWSVFNGGRAVDGDTNGNFDEGKSCFLSADDDDEPWWMVDLGQAFPVASVTIYNRADCCGSRLNNLEIRVYSENPGNDTSTEGQLCGEVTEPQPNGAVKVINCPAGVKGQFVRIVKDGELMSFCEVTIEAKEPRVCPRGFNNVEDRCLAFSTTYATFAEAITYCEMLDSNLLMIKTEDFDNAIAAYIAGNELGGHNYYVGASDMEDDDVYHWVDGSLVVSPWHPAGPRATLLPGQTQESGCGYLNTTSTYNWEAMPCSEPNFFICQQ
ncbi:collectin-12-like [Haliotis rufescens]|uniref:collectin-12-like n=1 Tax=Haliotis rufescens TaxID=6454 RepID=UPI00201F44F9|nr:collectin-12-like [Haliotis rufescens]